MQIPGVSRKLGDMVAARGNGRSRSHQYQIIVELENMTRRERERRADILGIASRRVASVGRSDQQTTKNRNKSKTKKKEKEKTGEKRGHCRLRDLLESWPARAVLLSVGGSLGAVDAVVAIDDGDGDGDGDGEDDDERDGRSLRVRLSADTPPPVLRLALAPLLSGELATEITSTPILVSRIGPFLGRVLAPRYDRTVFTAQRGGRVDGRASVATLYALIGWRGCVK